MLERLGSVLSLAHKIPEYQGRADYLRQRAVIESLKRGFTIEEGKGIDLVDSASTTAIVLPNGEHLEFAIDGNGVAFARIKDGKYYPVSTSISENLLEQGRRYERLSRSPLRRVLHMPFEPRSRLYFELEKLAMETGDSVLRLYMILESREKRIREIEGLVTDIEFH